MLETIAESAKPRYKGFTSEWSEEDVQKFQHGYEEASNKGSHLSHYEEKPSIDDEMETEIVFFFNKKEIKLKASQIW